MAQIILETKRLILRELEETDLKDLKEILQDEAVMNAYNGAFNDLEVESWLHTQLHRYESDGYALWAVILKATNIMIGQCGLSKQTYKHQDIVELTYLFKKEYWHHGYAIEAAKACKEYAFNTLKLDKIYSIIKEDNHASINVALKNEMIYQETFSKDYEGLQMPYHLYLAKRKLNHN